MHATVLHYVTVAGRVNIGETVFVCNVHVVVFVDDVADVVVFVVIDVVVDVFVDVVVVQVVADLVHVVVAVVIRSLQSTAVSVDEYPSSTAVEWDGDSDNDDNIILQDHVTLKLESPVDPSCLWTTFLFAHLCLLLLRLPSDLPQALDESSAVFTLRSQVLLQG